MHRAVTVCVLLSLSAPTWAQGDKKTASPTSAASQPGEPTNAGGLLEQGKLGVEFIKAKNWWGAAAVIIFALIFIAKSVRDKFWPQTSKRWLYIVVPSLTVAATLCAAFIGGVSWSAVWLVLSSGPTAALLNDFVKRGILNK
jgi:hypothetical protein